MIKNIFRRLKVPHAFIFLSGIILFCSVLTYIIPSGVYERTTKSIGDVERTIVIPGTYKKLPKHFSFKGIILGDPQPGKASPVSILGLFTAIPKGMSQAADLIFFIFIVGAVFTIIQETGTITAIVYRLMKKFKHSPILLPVLIFTVVAIAATMLGMGAEFIPMIPVFILVARELGYDRLIGISLLLMAESIGWTAGITNPFNVQIAQQVAEVPIGSGILFRAIFFVVCYAVGMRYFLWYGRKVRNRPDRSIMKDDDLTKVGQGLEPVPLKKNHLWIVLTAAILFLMILYAVQTMGWGLVEMSGGFLAVGVCTLFIYGMTGGEAMDAFVKGLQSMIIPALIVGIARGIQVVMNDGMIIDTLLHHASGVLQNQPKIIAAQGMFVFQSTLNFFIPSASGQALVTMPLLVPLSDLLQLSRQLTVFAFLIGDGISNIIIPTNGFLMAVLGIAGVPYEKWFRFILPLFLALMVLGAMFLTIAFYIGY